MEEVTTTTTITTLQQEQAVLSQKEIKRNIPMGEEDENHDNNQEEEERRYQSMTMEQFLEISRLTNTSTANLFRKYHDSGTGDSFRKEEVLAIVLDLQKAMLWNETLGISNKRFKRIAIVTIIFCILLLLSMFGLIYGVAILTTKINVTNEGVMTTSDQQTIVKTDSNAYIILPEKIENDQYCLTANEVDDMVAKIISGSNVILKLEGINQTHTRYEHLSKFTMDVQEDDESICFTSENGRQVCMIPSLDCETLTRRKLGFVTNGRLAMFALMGIFVHEP